MQDKFRNRAAVILCGGKSRRMGCPKALLPFGDETLLEFQVKRFSAVFGRIYISASFQIKELLDKEKFKNCRIIEDEHNAIGPLGGLYSCLKNTGEDVLFFTGVDSPFTDTFAAASLFDELKKSPEKSACALMDKDGRIQPAFCAYSKKALARIEEGIKNRDYRLKNIFTDDNAILKDMVLPREQFFNMNTVQDYYTALKKLSAVKPASFPPGFSPEIKKGLCPVVCIAAKSGTGKTTFLEKLIPLLKSKGLRICVIKHDAHKIELDKPGKDSFRLRQAGADEVIISSEKMTFDVTAHSGAGPDIDELIAGVNGADLIITEGYKFSSLPKICLLRKEVCEKPAGSAQNIIAFAADFPYESSLPVFDLNRPQETAEFLLDLVMK